VAFYDMLDLLDHWQTAIAGVLAFVAGVGTVVILISDTILARSGRNV
jgi:hypothetical protein